MTQMEDRIVLTRFKDGYGGGCLFPSLETYTQMVWRIRTKPGVNLLGHGWRLCQTTTCADVFEKSRLIKKLGWPWTIVWLPKSLRTHKEIVGWENFLGMTLDKRLLGSYNIDPKK